jgi:uncharacterized protein YfdQ (DUF2303 family)
LRNKQKNERKKTMEPTIDNVKTLLDAGRASGQVIELKEGAPFVVLPVGYKPESVEGLLTRPLRKKGTVTFQTLESFNRYVKEHKAAGTAIFTCLGGGLGATAVFDHHSGTEAGWGQHRAILNPLTTEAWRQWTGNSGKWLEQLAFATFLEERAADVVIPSAAEFKQIALELEARREVVFKSALRLSNGDVELTYKNETTAKGGVMEMPTEFEIRLQAHHEQPPITIQAFLRHKLGEGKISFKYELRQLEAVQELMRLELKSAIFNQTGIEVYAGAPQ